MVNLLIRIGAVGLLLGTVVANGIESNSDLSATSILSGLSFSLKFPDKLWEKGPAPTPGSQQEVTLLVLQSTEIDDKYRARFSIVEEKLGADLLKKSTSAYVDRLVEFLKNQRFQIHYRKKRMFAGKEAEEVRAFQRDFGLIQQQMVFTEKGFGYLVACAAREKSFETYASRCEALATSVKISP